MFNVWGLVIIEAGIDMREGIDTGINYIGRLNCKLTPISQILLRVG